MAVAAHHLTTGSDSTNGTSFKTAGIAPNPGRLLLCAVLVSSGTSPTPPVTLTGCGVTWVEVVANPDETGSLGARTIHLFRAMGSPTAGELTISTSGAALSAALWQVVEFSGVDTTGTNGSGAIVQSTQLRTDGVDVTSISKAFTAAVAAGNASYAAVGLHSVQEALAAGSGWTVVSQGTVPGPQSAMMGEFSTPARQTVTASWTTLTDAFLVAAEIKAGSGDTVAPSTPASISASASSPTSATIGWAPSTDNTAVASYRVRRNGQNLAGALAVVGTSFVDSTAEAGSAYSYTVSAVDAAGNRSPESTAATIVMPAESAPAATFQLWDGASLRPLTISVWDGAALIPVVNGDSADTIPPTTPTNLTATAPSPTRVELAWSPSTDDVGVDGYRIRRNGVILDDATGTTFTDVTVSPSSPLSYTVQAYDEAGNFSAESAAATVTTPAATDTTKPSTPSGVTATADSDSTISLSWNPSTDASGIAHYVVLRGGTVVASRVTSTQFLAIGLTPSTAYSFTVQAVDNSGNVSAESATATATTLAAGGGGTPGGGPVVGDFVIGVTAAQIQALPRSGAEWTNLKRQADGAYTHNPGGGEADGSGNALAGALVYVATGDTAYRTKVINALNAVQSTPSGAWQHAAVSRKLGGWALAGNLVGHTTPAWHAFLKSMLSFNTGTHGRTTPLSKVAWHWDNNHGGAGMLAYVAICAVLKIKNETIGGYPGGLDNAARWLRGFCGDRSSSGFGHVRSTDPAYGSMGSTGEAIDRGWHMDENRPYGIGPSSAVWGSAVPLTRDGAVPSDAVRGTTADHPTVGADGRHYVPGNAGRRTGAAMILAANGHPDVWTTADHALYRYRAWFERMYGAIEGNHGAYDPIAKKVYGRKFNTSGFDHVPSGPEETLTGTDWLALIPSWPVRPSTLT